MDSDTFLSKKKVAVVISVTSVYNELTDSKSMLAVHFHILLLKFLINGLGTSSVVYMVVKF